MPFARPSLTGLRNQAIEDIETSGVPGLDGLLRNAVLRVLAWVMAGLCYLVYGYADWISRMGVPFTAENEYLYAWAGLIGIYPEDATAANGSAQFTGTPSTALPSGTPLTRQDGTPYVTTADGITDATGTVVVPFVATVVGAFTNCDSGTAMNIAAPISAINSAGVTVGPTVGGADQETDAALRSRMLFKYREPPQGGANADFIEWALEVPGCTRAWVVPQGYGAGSVAIFPMFDDVEAAHGGFPQGTDGCAAEEVRGPTASGDQLLVAEHVWTVQPVTCLTYVAAPTPFYVDVTLEGLDPDTDQMQTEIQAALVDAFLVIGEIEGVVWPSDLYAAIIAVPGVNHFEMTQPTVALQAPPGALPVLGTFTVIAS
jgi:uncharacterized phage protein gp47/JayE